METFEDAYDHLISHTDQKSLRVITNIHYFYECSDGAKAEQENTRTIPQLDPNNNNKTDLDMDIDSAEAIEENQEGIFCQWEEITVNDIERAHIMKTHAREQLYGEIAVNLGYETGFFKETHHNIASSFTARNLQADKGEKIRIWETQLKNTTCNQINKFGTINLSNDPNEVQSSIVHVESTGTAPEIRPQTEGQPLADHIKKGSIERSEPSNLN